LFCITALSVFLIAQEETSDKQKIAWLKENAIRVDLDRKDFRFLDKALKDVDIVLLGEISHGDGKTFTVKTELIKYLHKKLDFNVLVFESGMVECHLTWQALKNGEPGKTAFPKSIFPIWGRSEQVQDLFSYIEENIGTENELELSGFDMQMTGNIKLEDRIEHLSKILLFENRLAFESAFPVFTSIFINLQKFYRDKPDAAQMEAFFNELDQMKQQIQAVNDKNIQQKILSRALVYLPRFFYFIWNLDPKKLDYKVANIREEEMGKNLIWLKENLYPGKKIIVWGASSHLSWNRQSIEQQKNFVPMGQYVKDYFDEKVYSIVFSAYTGMDGNAFTTKKRNIEDVTKESTEYLLSEAGFENAFLNFRELKKKGGWMDEKFILRPFGYTNFRANWPTMCDALFFMRKMTPSTAVK
jgi:erythromycin esterase